MVFSKLNSSECQLQPDDLTGCLDQLQMLADAAAIEDAAPTDRLIDWNVLQPDGSQEALDSLLHTLSRRFNADMFLGCLSRAGHARQIYSSEPGWALSNASHCGFATCWSKPATAVA